MASWLRRLRGARPDDTGPAAESAASDDGTAAEASGEEDLAVPPGPGYDSIRETLAIVMAQTADAQDEAKRDILGKLQEQNQASNALSEASGELTGTQAAGNDAAAAYLSKEIATQNQAAEALSDEMKGLTEASAGLAGAEPGGEPADEADEPSTLLELGTGAGLQTLRAAPEADLPGFDPDADDDDVDS